MSKNNYSFKNYLLLIHPVFISSVFILLINDWLLKSLYPSFITGKLSDFAGLFLFPIFIAVVLNKLFKTKTRILILYFITGIFFICWKVLPFELFLNSIKETLQIPVPTRVKDITDIMALSILPISYLFLINNYYIQTNITSLKRIYVTIMIIISSFSILATSMSTGKSIKSAFYIKTENIPEALFQFEKVLIQNGFDMRSRFIDDDGNYIYVCIYQHKVVTEKHQNEVETECRFILQIIDNTIVLEKVDFTTFGADELDAIYDQILEEKIIGPLQGVFYEEN